MKKSLYRKLLSMTVAVSALSMMLATGAGAESFAADNTSASSAVKEPGALTPPPPQEFNTLGISGNYQYLLSGNTYISAIGNGKLQLSGDTTAKTSVSTIRATVYLQKFNGTSWEDVSGSSSSFMDSASDYVSGNAVFTGVKGYYYRSKCLHYISTSSISEQAYSYSASVLCF
ncbi:hypothetical protein MUG84_11930 [Paenibacillus sp. KQZ6P-2]|uniref:Uncharacterized protein n=1 Tax=Paenibacillus mangrovi TaxID=2931978 RepID=A0A9X1WND5_9BACL|nr:hypothetical protein [Paenibacillus mangrovi]MCJ8012442.1 hypothetical protein [Paenibacillus mangrovi]